MEWLCNLSNDTVSPPTEMLYVPHHDAQRGRTETAAGRSPIAEEFPHDRVGEPLGCWTQGGI